jgi:hypothetical protein
MLRLIKGAKKGQIGNFQMGYSTKGPELIYIEHKVALQALIPKVTGMIRQTKYISIWTIFCFLCLSCVSICIAQDFPLDSGNVDCAGLVTAGQNAEAFSCLGMVGGSTSP